MQKCQGFSFLIVLSVCNVIRLSRICSMFTITSYFMRWKRLKCVFDGTAFESHPIKSDFERTNKRFFFQRKLIIFILESETQKSFEMIVVYFEVNSRSEEKEYSMLHCNWIDGSLSKKLPLWPWKIVFSKYVRIIEQTRHFKFIFIKYHHFSSFLFHLSIVACIWRIFKMNVYSMLKLFMKTFSFLFVCMRNHHFKYIIPKFYQQKIILMMEIEVAEIFSFILLLLLLFCIL